MLKNLYGEARASLDQAELNKVLSAHERYVSSQGGMRGQLAHKILNGLNLANRQLSEADFSGASLVDATMFGSNLERASLYCADLRGCNMQSANLTKADLRGASFKGAVLSHAKLDFADLRAAMMMYTGPNGVETIGSGRSGEKSGGPVGVDFSCCSMKNVSFGSAKLDGANFDGALLHGAKFKNAQLTNVTFKGAVLIGVDMKDLNVPPEALVGCVADVAPGMMEKFPELKARLDAHQEWISTEGFRGAPGIFDGDDLRPLTNLMVGRLLSGLSAKHVIGVGLDFSGCHLQAARFDGADLRDANFTQADLRGASFTGAKLAHAKFERANLSSLQMANGSKIDVNMTGAEARSHQFSKAILNEDGSSILGLAEPV